VAGRPAPSTKPFGQRTKPFWPEAQSAGNDCQARSRLIKREVRSCGQSSVRFTGHIATRGCWKCGAITATPATLETAGRKDDAQAVPYSKPKRTQAFGLGINRSDAQDALNDVDTGKFFLAAPTPMTLLVVLFASSPTPFRSPQTPTILSKSSEDMLVRSQLPNDSPTLR
jgi:hypothetical protein